MKGAAMSYHISKKVQMTFEKARERTIEELAGEGFGVLTEIDVRKTMKEKLGADFPDYRIIGACNPSLALEALTKEERIGLMLPCNVVVRTSPEGETEVSAIDPVASMQAVGNEELAGTGRQVREKLTRVIERI